MKMSAQARSSRQLRGTTYMPSRKAGTRTCGECWIPVPLAPGSALVQTFSIDDDTNLLGFTELLASTTSGKRRLESIKDAQLSIFMDCVPCRRKCGLGAASVVGAGYASKGRRFLDRRKRHWPGPYAANTKVASTGRFQRL
jgi:hypothetical protein